MSFLIWEPIPIDCILIFRHCIDRHAVCPSTVVGLRAEEGINATILLAFESVFGVASMGTYNTYAPIDAP